MAKYKISVNAETCIGCGACVSTCPDLFEMQGDKSVPKKTEVEDIGCGRDAAEVCPVNAIKITEG